MTVPPEAAADIYARLGGRPDAPLEARDVALRRGEWTGPLLNAPRRPSRAWFWLEEIGPPIPPDGNQHLDAAQEPPRPRWLGGISTRAPHGDPSRAPYGRGRDAPPRWVMGERADPGARFAINIGITYRDPRDGDFDARAEARFERHPNGLLFQLLGWAWATAEAPTKRAWVALIEE